METLEAYGIRDVSPRKSAGSSERLRGEFLYERHLLKLYVGDEYFGSLWNAKYRGIKAAGTRLYSNGEAAVWLSEVRYN